MSHTSRIVSRMVAAGCVFKQGAPATAQYKSRGHEPNTWLVRRQIINSRMHLVDRVDWLFGEGTEQPSAGTEITLDVPAAILAGTPCLVGYTISRDLWYLRLATLDVYAKIAQALLGPRVEFVHWIEKKRPLGPVGHHCNILARSRVQATIVDARYFGQQGVDPQVGVRARDQSRGVEWLRLSEVEVGKPIGA